MAKRRSNRSGSDVVRREQPRPPAEDAPLQQQGERVAAHVRDRQRQIAEREASRLARPEIRTVKAIGHADRKKSAVLSTPFGIHHKSAASAVSPDPEASEWCGPFSIARQMLAKREELRRLKEAEEAEEAHHPLDQAMLELEEDRKRKAHPSMQWKGTLSSTSSSKSLYAKRQKRANLLTQGKAVPSLFDLCIQFLVDNFEYVESLGDVDTSIRTALASALVAENKLNSTSFQAIAETGIEALEIVDCSEITQEDLAQKLKLMLPAGLRYLALDQSGRCFGSKAVQVILENSTNDSRLFALSIGGAYMLKDDDAAKLVQVAAPSSLEFKACPLLSSRLCESISNTFASQEKLLELSLEDLSLTESDLNALLASPAALKNLKSLSLRRIEGLNDDIVTNFIKYTGDTLEGIDLSENHGLTDNILAAIRVHGTKRLHALTLSGLKQVTSLGLEALFTFVDGAVRPPMLRTLNLGNCDHEAVTDDVIRLATQAATQNHESNQKQIAVLGGLVHINVQGSSVLTDSALEELAATSSSTLEELNVSFCPRVTDKGLGYLVDKCNRQLSKIHVWGNAQLTDEFFDGNHRYNDPTLEICGIWMKKHTSRTIR
jgi:hypothetical protein